MEEKELFPEGHYPWPKRRKYIVITLEVSLSNAVKELDKALHGWEEAELDKIIAFTNGQVRVEMQASEEELKDGVEQPIL